MNGNSIVRWALMVFCVAWWAEGDVTPSRAELLKAEPEVRKATQELLAGLARGETTRSEVAETVRIMGSQSADFAEEYLFLQGAFRLFVRSSEFARATEILRHMRSRDFPLEALIDLTEQALEPVPRGVDTGTLDDVLRDMRDDLARTRRVAVESAVTRGLETVRFPRLEPDSAQTLPEFLDLVRGALRNEGRPVFHYVLRCPMTGDGKGEFPVSPVGTVDTATLSSAMTRFCGEGGYVDRVHGPLRFLTRSAPFDPASPARQVRFAGNTEATTQRLKRIRFGFVAFDGNETIDEAVERLLRAVVDQGRQSENVDFDVVLRSPPHGRFPRMHTLRIVDTTLFDVFSLLCSAVEYNFKISGECAILIPR